MRRIFFVAVMAAVLVVLGVLALLESLGRGQLRSVVEARLSATLGQPVTIGRLRVSLFPAALSGADVRVGEAPSQAPKLEIGSVRIVPRLRSMLSGGVLIEQVQLQAFTMSVLRDERGAWHVPSVVPAPGASQGGGVTIERVRIAEGHVRVYDRRHDTQIVEAGSIDDLEADVTVESGGLRFAPIQARIWGAKISGHARTDAGTIRAEFAAPQIADTDLPVFIRLLGSERPSFLHLAEAASVAVSLQVDRATSHLSGKGTLKGPQVAVDPLQLQRFEAPFGIDGSRLEFNPTTFAMYGGDHRGGVTVQLGETPPAWIADSRVNNLNIGGFLKALIGQEQQLDGTAAVNATMRGRVGESLEHSVKGRAQLTVMNGVIRRFPLIAAINRTLRLAQQEGDDTRFERLSGNFAITGGVATTEDLALEAGHVRVRAQGRIGANRSISMRGVAVVSAERAAAAVASVHEFARLRNSNGEIEVPLTISGTLDAPSFAVDVSAAARKGLVDEVRRRLRRLIR